MVHLRFRDRRSFAVAALFAVALVLVVGQRPALASVPVVRPDAYSTPMNTTLTVAAPGVLANDTDADGDKLTVGMPGMPRHGTLSISANGGFTYKPAVGYSGTDSFSYMTHDTHGNMIPGTVTLTVGSGGGGGGGTPTLAVGNAKVTEPNSGATDAKFTITRSSGTGASSVTFSTVDGTAMAGSDYTAVPATVVNFAAGETVKTVTVKVLGDNAVEMNEKFSMKLTNATGATISDAKGVGTILNND